MLGLFNKSAAAQKTNLVMDWLLVTKYPERWNFMFFVDFKAYFVCFIFSQVVQKQMLDEVGNWTAI